MSKMILLEKRLPSGAKVPHSTTEENYKKNKEYYAKSGFKSIGEQKIKEEKAEAKAEPKVIKTETKESLDKKENNSTEEF